MKDHVESSYLTKFDAFGMNREQVRDLETWFKIHTKVSNFQTGFRVLTTKLGLLESYTTRKACFLTTVMVITNLLS